MAASVKYGQFSLPDKTKYMRSSASPSQRSVRGATVNGVTYEGVAEFVYLGIANQ